ncbi:MAG: alpha/beta hydrolase [Anaerolineae bacterium]|nr:alpha/beta hydrolase [Anaerolineae bacterium]
MFGQEFKKLKIKTTDAEINLVHGGSGPPLLFMHGYPQTHVMWRQVAPRMAEHFHVICPDLRGYGDSSKPATTSNHAPYSKRAMGQDMVEVMAALGYDQFYAAGHDRGGRVLHRLILDHPERVTKACVMDIAPTYYMFKHTDQAFATGYYHWFFLIQPEGLPEQLIGADPGYYLTEKLRRWSGPDAFFDPKAVREYIRCFENPAMIHATCEDYRAAASIDLEHDEADMDQKITCPLLVLWGKLGFVHRTYDVLATWRERATQVEGYALDSCGHFLPEERPNAVYGALMKFFEK